MRDIPHRSLSEKNAVKTDRVQLMSDSNMEYEPLLILLSEAALPLLVALTFQNVFAIINIATN